MALDAAMDVVDVDVNGPRHAAMQLFDLGAGFPFTSDLVDTLVARRAALTDALVFDLLLAGGGVENPAELYPPRDSDALVHLVGAIRTCAYDGLKKDCLLYYLLKACPGDDGATRRRNFLGLRAIPPQFVLLSDAYWELDGGGDLRLAASILCDARINRDYPSKIMQALARPVDRDIDIYFPGTDVADLVETAPFVARYARVAKPALFEPDDLDLYLVALAAAPAHAPLGVIQAWQFQRTFPEHSETRARLIRLLIDWCFTPAPRPEAVKTLLGLPFTPAERALLHQYATAPPAHLSPTAVGAVRDLAVTRLLAAGAHGAALRLDSRLGGGAREPEPAARARRALLDDVRAALPSAECAALADDLARAPDDSPLGASWADISAADVSVMSAVFDDAPTASPSASARISQRTVASGRAPEVVSAPRFGLGLAAPHVGPRTPAAAPSSTPVSSTRAPVVAFASPIAAAATPTRPTGSPAAGSLFDTMGSARRARNAFFDPSVSATAPMPAPGDMDLELDGVAPSPALTEGADADISTSMDIDVASPDLGADKDTPPVLKEETPAPDEEEEAAEAAEAADAFDFSVFRGPPPPTAFKIARTETEHMLPPGAFYTQNGKYEPVAPSPPPVAPTSARKQAAQRASASASPPPTPAPRDRRRTARGAGTESVPTAAPTPRKRRVPGALDDDALDGADDGDASEGADAVPPLPAKAPRTSARGRGARASSAAGTVSGSEDDGPAARTPRRRSTRKSGASAATGTDDDAVSAPAPRASKARAPAGANGAKRESTRRKR